MTWLIGAFVERDNRRESGRDFWRRLDRIGFVGKRVHRKGDAVEVDIYGHSIG